MRKTVRSPPPSEQQGHVSMPVVAVKQAFHKPVADPKDWKEILHERQQAKQAAEDQMREALRKEQEERNKLPGWKRAMIEKKEREAQQLTSVQAQEQEKEAALRAKFAHLPGWKAEIAIRKEREALAKAAEEAPPAVVAPVKKSFPPPPPVK
jgi:hypothetical protein